MCGVCAICMWCVGKWCACGLSLCVWCVLVFVVCVFAVLWCVCVRCVYGVFVV